MIQNLKKLFFIQAKLFYSLYTSYIYIQLRRITVAPIDKPELA